MEIEAELGGQAAGPLGEALHHLVNGVEAAGAVCAQGRRKGRGVGGGGEGSQELGQDGAELEPGRGGGRGGDWPNLAATAEKRGEAAGRGGGKGSL
jgi:hypothetical protein